MSCLVLHFKCLKIHNPFLRNLKLSSYLSTQTLNNAETLANEQILQDEKNKFTPFLNMVKNRQAEAKRSILVQVQSSKSYKELHSYCSSIGTVKKMFHYVSGVEPLNFIIVEFAKELDVTNILSKSSHVEDNQIVPVQSQFLWFKASNRKSPKLKPTKDPTLSIENGNCNIKQSELNDLLTRNESISDQIKTLYESTKLNDLGTRLRFLTARQIEIAVGGMFPNAEALPFGSSVNGFGKMGCDLDLVLRLLSDKIDKNSRLVFHCKASYGSERSASQRHMEAIGDLIQLFLPGCAQVRKILQARVPIIKYYQQLTDVECDLSMINTSGFHMSDFLYIMGSIDERVRPLVFAVRKWACEIGLTNSSPGRWLTNFSLTLLVLAFLQRPPNSPPILPSLNTLVKLSGKNDKIVTEEGINCTFLRNIKKLEKKSTNSSGLGSLLCEFFEFYSQFDFTSKAISLNEAVALPKPEHCAIYIVNPLERGLNVSKNVSFEELEKFKVEARNAAWILESQEDKSGEKWGLLSIFDHQNKKSGFSNFSFSSKQGRLVNVSTLFEEEIEYKNETIKNQVRNIKDENRNTIIDLQKSNR